MVSRRELLASGWLLARCLGAAVRSGGAFPSYEQVEPLFEACSLALPPDLARLDGAGRRRAWPAWIGGHDAAVRARLRRGEEDSLVNFVLFGVSFTRQPRVTDEPAAAPIEARIADFMQALAIPGSNERLLWLKGVMAGRGRPFVEGLVSRYLAEQARYRAVLDKAPAGDPAVSQLYKDRGLSVDTSFRPNWAIDQTLAGLKQRGALTSVRRAAIIGPGLDFTDKDRGFDYYPLQTLQPFGLADSLLRLGLATAGDLRIGLLDISAQTLDHVARAVAAARPYTVQLVLDGARAWNPDLLAWWWRFGDRVGVPAEAAPVPPGVGKVLTRAVRIRPKIVALLEPSPLNIATQRTGEKYDLVIATNVLVYYDAFDRALAASNIGAMMATGGIFLSNSPLPDCSSGSLHPTGSVDVRYSSVPGDDDRVEIYSNARFSRPLAPQ